jgi:predicted SAM-dependent methyltransferase
VQVAGKRPLNFSFIKIDGTHLPLPDGSVDFFYSNQLMEHLHPDDAQAQLDEIYRVLSPGGFYFCSTPHAFTGPHDVSKYFDDYPTGFHLIEYRYADLTRLFRAAGFSKISIVWERRGRYLVAPSFLGVWLEKAVMGLLGAYRSQLSLNRKIHALMGIMILGQKGAPG